MIGPFSDPRTASSLSRPTLPLKKRTVGRNDIPSSDTTPELDTTAIPENTVNNDLLNKTVISSSEKENVSSVRCACFQILVQILLLLSDQSKHLQMQPLKTVQGIAYVCTERIFDSQLLLYNKIFLDKF